jgi:EPS-associated MarR family transcriptional regulator
MKAQRCVHCVNTFDITMSIAEQTNLEKEEVLKVLREIKSDPETTQRVLSSNLGISLGKVNFIMKALIHRGFIKVHNFKNSSNKSAYLYYLTPKGVEEKARITYRFLRLKIKEYEDLEQEIHRLKQEVGEAQVQQEIRD